MIRVIAGCRERIKKDARSLFEEMPCFRRLAAAFRASHSKPTRTLYPSSVYARDPRPRETGTLTTLVQSVETRTMSDQIEDKPTRGRLLLQWPANWDYRGLLDLPPAVRL